jgi:hypothetical protein
MSADIEGTLYVTRYGNRQLDKVFTDGRGTTGGMGCANLISVQLVGKDGKTFVSVGPTLNNGGDPDGCMVKAPVDIPGRAWSEMQKGLPAPVQAVKNITGSSTSVKGVKA